MTDDSSPEHQQLTTNVSSDQRNIAILCHLGGIILGFIPSLLVYLIKTDDEYLRAHGKEALNFQITVLIAFVACWVLMFLFIGFLLIPIVWILNIVFCIIAAVKAGSGEMYRYPVAIPLLQ